MAGDRAVPSPARRQQERVVAWRPQVPGVAEVLHARFVDHVYPPHTHDVWTLLIIDEGAVRFDLDRREHGAVPSRVTLLPPHVAHTGRAGTDGGFRKRVIYLETSVLPAGLTGAAVAAPDFADPLLRRRVDALDAALSLPGEALEAESRLALVCGRLRTHLGGGQPDAASRRGVADDLRDLLDGSLSGGLTLRAAGEVLHAHPDHLVRAFTTAFGLPPHRYLTVRRIDAARRRLLAGESVAAVAAAVGFYDQAHLTRHFVRQLGTTPARYAASTRRTHPDGRSTGR